MSSETILRLTFKYTFQPDFGNYPIYNPNKKQLNLIKLQKGKKYYIKTTSMIYVKDMMSSLDFGIEVDKTTITQHYRGKWFRDICSVDGLNGLYIENSALMISGKTLTEKP